MAEKANTPSASQHQVLAVERHRAPHPAQSATKQLSDEF